MDEEYVLFGEFSSDDDSIDDDIELDQEEWQDWNSEELLNLWMTIVEYHENWYLPLNRNFNQFCEFVFSEEEQSFTFAPEIQAIKNHPLVRDRDWHYFFSLSYK